MLADNRRLRLSRVTRKTFPPRFVRYQKVAQVILLGLYL